MYVYMYTQAYIEYVTDFMHKASPVKFNRSMLMNISLVNNMNWYASYSKSTNWGGKVVNKILTILKAVIM